MGSWNETCCLTNLPICYGDKTVTLLIVNQSPQLSPLGTVRQNNYWLPVSLPFYTKYDDYSQFELIDDSPYVERMFSKVRKNIIDPDLSKDFSWDRFMEILIKKDRDSMYKEQKNYLSVNGLANPSMKRTAFTISTFNMHRHIFTQMMGDYSYDRWGTIRNYLTECKEAIDEYNKRKLLSDNEDPMLAYRIREHSLSSLKDGAPNALLNFGVQYDAEWIFENQTDDNIERLAMYMKLNYLMDNLRKPYAPQHGVGHQSTEYELYGKLAQLVLDFTTERLDPDYWDKLDEDE